MKTTVIWALVLTILLAWFGYYYSFGLVHAGGPLLLIYLPVLLTESILVNTSAPEWLRYGAAFLAQFVGCFIFVILVKALIKYFKNINKQYIG